MKHNIKNLKIILSKINTIAIVGASSNTKRDSFKVMKYLIDSGYEVFPVNPNEAKNLIFENSCEKKGRGASGGGRNTLQRFIPPSPRQKQGVQIQVRTSPPYCRRVFQSHLLWRGAGHTTTQGLMTRKPFRSVLTRCTHATV